MKIHTLFILIFSVFACTSPKKDQQALITPTPITKAENGINLDGKLFTALYQQQAAEYKALCFQAYNLARYKVDDARLKRFGQPKAIITDIDETIFDNSPYSVHQALQGKDYVVETWHDWTNQSNCDTLAGSLSFFKYAADKKIEIFYITNRDSTETNSTLKNMIKFGFPFADKEHLLTKQTSSSKEDRRKKVDIDHDIILFIGDNLADFSDLFDKKTTEERLQNTISHAADFGDKYIILPNPNYGDWENALYKYNFVLTTAQKDTLIKAALKNY